MLDKSQFLTLLSPNNQSPIYIFLHIYILAASATVLSFSLLELRIGSHQESHTIIC